MKAKYFNWVIISLLFSLNILSYIDRSAISYAVPQIMHALHLSTSEMGMILGAFGIGYLITTFISGFMVDRWGPRNIILSFTLLWAASMFGTGAMTGALFAYLARFGLGLGEGPNFPALARSVSDWLPLKSRGKAFSNSLVAVPLSLAIGGPIATLLISSVGWRWMFGILGFAILLWWPFYYFLFSNKPKESRFISSEQTSPENKLEQSTRIKAMPWRQLIKNKTLLSNCWGFFVYGFVIFFFMTWLPYFLEKSYHLNVKQVGMFSFLPWMMAAFMLWGMGYFSDRIYKKTKHLRYARSYPMVAGQLLSLLCLVPIVLWHNLDLTLISISFAVAFSASSNTLFYSTNLDIQKERAGSLLGIMNSGFALAGFLAPVLTGELIQITGTFQSVFWLIILLILSSVLFMFFYHRPDDDMY